VKETALTPTPDDAANELSKNTLTCLALDVGTETNSDNAHVITAKNVADARVLFKIRTTVPRAFVVKPSIGILNPGSSEIVTVTSQQGAAVDAKFQVQAMVLEPSELTGSIADIGQEWKRLETADLKRVQAYRFRLPSAYGQRHVSLATVAPTSALHSGTTTADSTTSAPPASLASSTTAPLVPAPLPTRPQPQLPQPGPDPALGTSLTAPVAKLGLPPKLTSVASEPQLRSMRQAPAERRPSQPQPTAQIMRESTGVLVPAATMTRADIIAKTIVLLFAFVLGLLFDRIVLP